MTVPADHDLLLGEFEVIAADAAINERLLEHRRQQLQGKGFTEEELRQAEERGTKRADIAFPPRR